MTLDDLVNECWADLPPVRKRLAGRDAVRLIVVNAVQEWSPEYLMACQDNAQRDVYASDMIRRLRRRHEGQQEYGFAIMSIIMVALISAVVQWLVKWWLDRNVNRVLMAGWKMEMAA